MKRSQLTTQRAGTRCLIALLATTIVFVYGALGTTTAWSFWSEGCYTAWPTYGGGDVHGDIDTLAAAGLGLDQVALSEIINASEVQDLSAPYDASDHFDRNPPVSDQEVFVNSAHEYQSLLAHAIADANQDPLFRSCVDSQATLGAALHDLQDFFSHSNFVDYADGRPLKPADQVAALNALINYPSGTAPLSLTFTSVIPLPFNVLLPNSWFSDFNFYPMDSENYNHGSPLEYFGLGEGGNAKDCPRAPLSPILPTHDPIFDSAFSTAAFYTNAVLTDVVKKTANSGCFVPTPTPTPGGNSDPDNDGDSGGDNDNDGDGSGVAGSGNTGNCPPSTQVPPRPSSDCHQASTHEPGDPNDKLGPHGVGKAAFVSGRAPANYEVLFTNEATATAPAHEVVVTDQLDPHKYNLRTFSFLAFYFGNQQVVPPAGQKNFVTNVDLRPAQNMIVRINAALNLTTGAMLTRFDSLDPNTGLLIQDVSLGFLPPDVSPPQGEGGVVFGVSPASGLATGSTVSNSASIVFDAQPAISTPTWTNTVDSSSPTSQIMALPHQESCPNFLVDASASDVGAGLAPLNFYVSDNGGAFQPWLTTERRQNIYPGAPGHAYSFYAMATDLVGNLEPAKTGAEASTSVASTEICGPPVIRANRNSVQFGNDTLTGNLELINLGGSDGSNLVVNSVTFGNSSGGQVALTSPALPQNLGAIRSGRLVNVPFAANLAAPVNSATVTVSGTVQDSGGNTHNWSNNFVIQNGEMASAGS